MKKQWKLIGFPLKHNAPSRDSLINHARALDRVLLAGHYVIPNYYIDTWRIAYWTHLAQPEVAPLYDYGLMTWWRKPDVARPTTEAEH